MMILLKVQQLHRIRFGRCDFGINNLSCPSPTYCYASSRSP
jgi:hypothetical protein